MNVTFKLEDIKYLKVLYHNKENSACVIKGAVKRINEREIVSCMKYEEGFEIDTPQNITLSVVCNDGLYRTETRLKSVDMEDPYMFFILETPEGVEYQQNREYFRLPAESNCAYYVNTGEESVCLTGKTYDISANGVSILVPLHTISDEDAELEIMINEKIIRANVKYIRSEKTEDGYKLSFAYTKISDADRDYISQVCIKKQLEQKRNTLS